MIIACGFVARSSTRSDYYQSPLMSQIWNWNLYRFQNSSTQQFMCSLVCFFLMQLSFQMWTNQVHETINSKKKGDAAFRRKEFQAAVDCFTQVWVFIIHLPLRAEKLQQAKLLKFGRIYHILISMQVMDMLYFQLSASPMLPCTTCHCC